MPRRNAGNIDGEGKCLRERAGGEGAYRRGGRRTEVRVHRACQHRPPASPNLKQQGEGRLTFSKTKVDRVFGKTRGRCHACHKPLMREMRGAVGHRDEWQIDHGIPISRGGSSHISNLWPMCAACNRDKADLTGYEYRVSKMFPRPPATMFGGR